MANTLNLGTDGNWAIKEGALLGYNSENSNFKPLPFDFTRASTATYIAKDGLIKTAASDVPRIDFLDSTEGSLKLEPQRTNLFTYSEFMNGLSFTNATATDNAETSPDGAVNAARLYDDTADSQHRVSENISVVNTETYTWSIFVKQGSLRYCYLISTAAGTERYFFDLQEGLSLTSGGKIEDYGNGWYRLSAQATATSTGNALFGFNLTDSSSNRTYIGTGTDYHIIYGLQMEAGSYPTSYIKTSGSTATRVADACIQTVPDGIINSVEGAFYVEMNAFDNASRISLSDGSTNNRVSFKITDTNIDFQYRVGGVYSYRVDVDVDNSNTNKIAMSFNNGVFVGYVNGVAIGSPISGTSLGVGVLDRLNFNDGNAADDFYGNAKDVRVYNTALTDTELATLTTI